MRTIYIPQPDTARIIGVLMVIAGGVAAVHFTELPQRVNAVLFVAFWIGFISTLIAWAFNSQSLDNTEHQMLLPASFLLMVLCSFGVLGLLPALSMVSGGMLTGLTFTPIEQPAH